MNILRTTITSLALVVSAMSVASEPTIDSNLLSAENAFTSRVWTADYLGQYRIPGLAQTKHNILLAFAEKRDAQGDQQGNDIVLRRSLDGGRTWGNEQEIYSLGDDALNNPTVIATENNLLAMIFNVYPEGVHMSDTLVAGGNSVKVKIMYSTDNGSNWTAPIDVTEQVTPQAAYLTNIGPGNGFIIKNGSNSGRAVIASFAKFSNGRDFSDSRAVTVYNDELNNYQTTGAHKITQAEALELSQYWTHGSNNPLSMSNEISMVEYGDAGKLYYMGRIAPDNRTGGFRYDSSDDGGITWNARDKSTTVFPYRTQSGAWRFDNSADNSVSIVHTTPVGNYDYSKGRTDGRVVVTRNLFGDSLTWNSSTSRVITNEFFSNSSITQINDPVYKGQQRVGVLYEGHTDKSENKVKFINFSNIKLDYVRGGETYSRPQPY